MDIDRLKNRIKHHEGYSKDPYKDHLGYWTVGWGHNIHWITEMPQHEQWLKQDVREAIDNAQIWLPSIGELSDTRQEVIAEMFFQMGASRMEGFKRLRAALQDKDFERAAYEMNDSRWANQTPVRAQELITLMREG